jgi:hypothetical protein
MKQQGKPAPSVELIIGDKNEGGREALRMQKTTAAQG